MSPLEAYKIEYVKGYLQRPGFSLSGLDLRVFSTMGDLVGSAIAGMICPLGPVEDVTLQKILTAVSKSFEFVGEIEKAADRVPSATVTLLEDLMARADSAEQKERIQVAMEEIKGNTGASGAPTEC